MNDDSTNVKCNETECVKNEECSSEINESSGYVLDEEGKNIYRGVAKIFMLYCIVMIILCLLVLFLSAVVWILDFFV